MAFNFEVVNFTKDSSGVNNTTDTVSHGAFTAKAIVIFGDAATATGGSNTHGRLAIGLSDGTTENNCGIVCKDNAGTINSNRWQFNTDCIRIYDQEHNLQDVGTITAISSGSFDIQWTTNSTNAFKFTAVVIGGSDITGVEVGQQAADTTSGAHTQSFTTTVTDADVGFFLHSRATNGNIAGTHCRLGFGVSDGSKNGCVSITSQDATSNTQRYQVNTTDDACIAFMDQGAATKQGNGSVAFTGSGFDITWDANKNTSAYQINYLLLKGARWEVGHGTMKTSGTGTQAYTTTFQPVGLFNFNVGNTQSSSIVDNLRIGVGATDGTTSAWAAATDNDAKATSECGIHYDAGAAGSTSALRAIGAANASAAPDVDGQAYHDSFNATDFTLNFQDAAGSAIEFIWLVAAADAVAGGDVIYSDLHDISVGNVGVNNAASLSGVLET